MLLRVGCLFSFIKSPILSLCYRNRFHRPLLRYYSSFKPVNARIQYLNRLSMDKLTHPYTTATLVREPSSQPSTRPKKKLRRDSPEGVLRHKLDMCSKRGDLVEALKHYDEARVNQIPILLHHYNVLLYLCSSSASNVDCKENEEGSKRVCDLGLERGFEIFKQMGVDKVAPNEATFTSLARLAAAKEDPESAFDLVKHMRTCGLPPRLRSYGPALFGFCKKGMVDKAFEVDAHMGESGVLMEEAEISALLKVSSETKRADKVYEMLHRLRAMVRQVSEETARVLEDWFGSESGTEVGVENWDVEKVREGVVKGGGGWHGQGWLGSGKWRVVQTQMDQTGVCHSCGEKLVCIDIDPKETENFATSLASLACEREVKTNFMQFQEWLQRHGPFDAVIDGANVGLTDQHSFSFSQLNFVVNQLTQMSLSKRLPLIILHRNRVTNGPALSHNNKKFIESWKKSGALYATPRGSNDDWYWLYAAVSCKCLLVTNDEMRDHLFELLGTSFFPRWKEKHQVRLTVSRRGPTLHMPPPYSIVIQESEQGSWHVPTVTGNDVETPRQWVCATRARDS